MSNDFEQLLVSNRGKPENWISNSASTVIFVEEMCSEINGWNSVIASGVMVRENFS